MICHMNLKWQSLMSIQSWLISFLHNWRSNLNNSRNNWEFISQFLQDVHEEDVILVVNILQPIIHQQNHHYLLIQDLYQNTYRSLNIVPSRQMQLALSIFLEVRRPFLVMLQNVLGRDVPRNIPDEYPIQFEQGEFVLRLCHCPILKEVLRDVIESASTASSLRNARPQWLDQDPQPDIVDTVYSLLHVSQHSSLNVLNCNSGRLTKSIFFGCNVKETISVYQPQTISNVEDELCLNYKIRSHMQSTIRKYCTRVNKLMLSCLVQDYGLTQILQQCKDIFTCVALEQFLECLFVIIHESAKSSKNVDEVCRCLNESLNQSLQTYGFPVPSCQIWNLILVEENSRTSLNLYINDKPYSFKIQPNVKWPDNHSPLTSEHINRYNKSLLLLIGVKGAERLLSNVVKSSKGKGLILVGWQMRLRVVQFQLLNVLTAIRSCLLLQMDCGFLVDKVCDYTSIAQIRHDQDRLTENFGFVDRNPVLQDCLNSLITMAQSIVKHYNHESKSQELMVSFYKFRSFLINSLKCVPNDNPSRNLLLILLDFGGESH